MSKKILIIDDEPDILKFLEQLFQDEGYETATAVNGNDGYRKLAEAKPDLITLDLQMPEDTGTGFYRKMHHDSKYKDIPVIVITGISGQHAVRKAVAYLSKPFDPDKLLGIVRKTIGNSG